MESVEKAAEDTLWDALGELRTEWGGNPFSIAYVIKEI